MDKEIRKIVNAVFSKGYTYNLMARGGDEKEINKILNQSTNAIIEVCKNIFLETIGENEEIPENRPDYMDYATWITLIHRLEGSNSVKEKIRERIKEITNESK